MPVVCPKRSLKTLRQFSKLLWAAECRSKQSWLPSGFTSQRRVVGSESLLYGLKFQLRGRVDFRCCLELTFRILILAQTLISLPQQSVRDVVAGIHLLRMLQVQQCSLRIVSSQKDSSHKNERPGSRLIERDCPG